MDFMYKYGRLPKDRILLTNINSATNKLFDKLRALDVKSLNISDYNKRYFASKLGRLLSYLQLYSYILAWSVVESNVPLNKFVFLDYGGGSGILSLLAKESNIGTVIYNDIYEVSCKDARTIGESIGNQADYYVQGDIDDVIDFLTKNGINCNAVASYDVIEHIYDIEHFLRTLNKLSNDSLTIFMSSGANIFNWRIRRSLMKRQYEVEHYDRVKEFGHKERDTTRAYLKIRIEIISKYTDKISENEVKRLAISTRGMILSDIQKCVDTYLETKQFPKGLEHPTNTCDPYTGNWMEHLMDPYYLQKVLTEEGFRVQILSGFYGAKENRVKRIVAKTLDIYISTFEKSGIKVAPFFSIYAKK